MTNKVLRDVLNDIRLIECDPLSTDIYYIKKNVSQKVYDPNSKSFWNSIGEYEFLVIAPDGIKRAIILNCGNRDLHWYVLPQWRKRGFLSSALRTGIIKRVWPLITTVTCCFEIGEEEIEKRSMTEHLAHLAELTVTDETICW